MRREQHYGIDCPRSGVLTTGDFNDIYLERCNPHYVVRVDGGAQWRSLRRCFRCKMSPAWWEGNSLDWDTEEW